MSGFDHEGDFRIEGSLGVGVAEPEIELEVSSGDSEIGSRLSVGSELNGSFLSLFSGDNNNPPHIGMRDGKKLRIISTDGISGGVENDLVTISAGGNVGVGVVDPVDKLEVDGKISAVSIDAAEILKNGEPLQLSLWQETGSGIKHDGSVEAANIKTDSVKARSIDVNEILHNGKPLKTSPWKETTGGLKFEGKVTAQNIVTDLFSSGEVKTKSINSGQYLQNGKPLLTSNWDKISSGINYSKGKVGIGNKNPKASLDVNGLIKSKSVNTNTMTVGNGITFSNIQAGRVAVGRNNSRIKRNFRVKFPKAFKSVPIVMATARGLSHPDTFALTTTSVNKQEFRINILRMDAAVGWAQNLQLDWIALELAPVKFQSLIGVMGTSKVSVNKKKTAQRVRRRVLR